MTDEQKIAEALHQLQETVLSVQLATVSEQGEPHVGYTPFLIDDSRIVVFVSRLALHTQDLLTNARASVMIINDEAESKQIFARQRVTYQCHAVQHLKESDDYEQLLDRFEQRHGKMIGLLRQLPDFVLFSLVPRKGQFVMGFGKAYRLSGEKLDQFELARTG